MATEVPAQPEEILDVAFNYSNYTTGGLSIVSAVGFASRANTPWSATTVATVVPTSASTIILAHHPGVGALLTIGAGATQEKKKVTGVGALGSAFAAQLHSPLAFQHSAVEDVNYEPGVTPTYLSTDVGSINSSFVKYRTQYGASGQRYHLSSVATLSDGQKIEGQCFVVVLEV